MPKHFEDFSIGIYNNLEHLATKINVILNLEKQHSIVTSLEFQLH